MCHSLVMTAHWSESDVVGERRSTGKMPVPPVVERTLGCKRRNA